MIVYVDTSAAMKLVVREAESVKLRNYFLDEPDGEDRVHAASWLMHTELHCAAHRHEREIRPARVDEVLQRFLLIDLTRGDLLAASTVHGRLRTNDAIHLAVALRLEADSIITYDAELSEAARAAGLAVVAPA